MFFSESCLRMLCWALLALLVTIGWNIALLLPMNNQLSLNVFEFMHIAVSDHNSPSKLKLNPNSLSTPIPTVHFINDLDVYTDEFFLAVRSAKGTRSTIHASTVIQRSVTSDFSASMLHACPSILGVLWSSLLTLSGQRRQSCWETGENCSTNLVKEFQRLSRKT